MIDLLPWDYDENVQLLKSIPSMSKNSYVQVPIRINHYVQKKNVQLKNVQSYKNNPFGFIQ